MNTNKDLWILSHIVAVSSNHVIGHQNQLPWHIPQDLKFFHEKTKNHVVIMGRKTFNSLGKPLKQRINIVISKNKNFSAEGVVLVQNLEASIQRAKEHSQKKEIFIIGGSTIYKQSLSIVDKLYITRIHQSYKGDAFYPKISSNQFQLTHQEDHQGTPSFSFLTYVKNNNKIG